MSVSRAACAAKKEKILTFFNLLLIKMNKISEVFRHLGLDCEANDYKNKLGLSWAKLSSCWN